MEKNIITRTGRLHCTRGFTLMELMTVIAIIGILATIAVPSFQKSIIRAREANLSNSLFVLRDVIDQYYADHGTYPPTLASLVEKNYIRAIPMDPITGSTDTWILIPPQGEGASGIYDVHSGSDRISLYGTPYNEW
jgi:general secretion pathway protein G